MKNNDLNLRIVLDDKRFKGVRIAIVGLLLGTLGFFVGVFALHRLGVFVMAIGWTTIVIGFLVHLATMWRKL